MVLRFLHRCCAPIMSLLYAVIVPAVAIMGGLAFRDYDFGLRLAIPQIDAAHVVLAITLFGCLGFTLMRNRSERKRLQRELRYTRMMLEQTQRIAQVGSREYDLVRDKQRWSDEVYRIFEIDRTLPGVTHATFLQVVHPDDRARIAAIYADSPYCGDACVFDYRLLLPDGRVKDIRERRESWLDETGKPCRSFGTLQDITEVKLAEAMLENEKSRLRAVIDTIPDLVWIKDTEGVYLVCNPVFESFFGAKEADIVGNSDFAFVDHELAEFFRSKDRDAMNAGHPCVNEEWVNFASDGRHVLLETIKTPFRDERGRIAGVLGIARDITERQRMADALHMREQEFRTIAENSPDVIARYDRGCRHVYANPALQKLAGRPAAAFLGRTVLEVAGGRASFREMEEKLKQALETGKETEVELIDNRLPGAVRPICDHIRFTPEFGRDGTVVSVLAIGRDIGALKETERQLMRSRALLQTLAARQEQDREQERKRIAWEVHEELGQMMMALRINFGLLNDGIGGNTMSQRAQLALLTDLLDRSISMVREVATGLRPSVLDLGIDSALEWLTEKFIEQSGIPSRFHLAGQELVMDDEYVTTMFRIVQEALDNISRHAQARSVEIALERRGGDYFLEVRDDGQGFDPDTPKEKSLGLLGIQERVRRLGGTMAISSAPGKGTVLGVRMPVRSEAA